MKVMTILGSPKKKGNTAAVLGMFERLIANDHDVDRVDISDCDVKGCAGCYACQSKPNEPGCVLKDDAVPILERMMKADILVYATPLYCWSFTAHIKALLEHRHLCLVTGYGTPEHNSLIAGKRVALLVTCGGPVENNADLIQGIFDRMFGFLKGDVVGKYVVPFCTTPDKMGDHAGETAEQMAGDLVG